MRNVYTIMVLGYDEMINPNVGNTKFLLFIKIEFSACTVYLGSDTSISCCCKYAEGH
jgi:hypothetical protein